MYRVRSSSRNMPIIPIITLEISTAIRPALLSTMPMAFLFTTDSPHRMSARANKPMAPGRTTKNSAQNNNQNANPASGQNNDQNCIPDTSSISQQNQYGQTPGSSSQGTNSQNGNPVPAQAAGLLADETPGFSWSSLPRPALTHRASSA